MASHPPDFAPLLAAIGGELRRRDLPFMLIGGQAVLLHGSPRLTHDIDLALGVGPDGIQTTLSICEAVGLRPLAPNPERFARETFVCPALHEASGVRVDFIFATTPFEQVAIGRAVRVAVGDESVPFASAEDLILLKLFAGRPRERHRGRPFRRATTARARLAVLGALGRPVRIHRRPRTPPRHDPRSARTPRERRRMIAPDDRRPLSRRYRPPLYAPLPTPAKCPPPAA